MEEQLGKGALQEEGEEGLPLYVGLLLEQVGLLGLYDGFLQTGLLGAGALGLAPWTDTAGTGGPSGTTLTG